MSSSPRRQARADGDKPAGEVKDENDDDDDDEEEEGAEEDSPGIRSGAKPGMKAAGSRSLGVKAGAGGATSPRARTSRGGAKVVRRVNEDHTNGPTTAEALQHPLLDRLRSILAHFSQNSEAEREQQQASSGGSSGSLHVTRLTLEEQHALWLLHLDVINEAQVQATKNHSES
jgi:hypothetical protein